MTRLLICLLMCGSLYLGAQSPRDIAIPLTVSTGINPPAVFLSWENNTPSDVVLRRRVKGAAGNSWTNLVSANETLLNGYFDTGLDGNLTYEYALERKTGAINAYGFAHANFFTPVVDDRGKILVFIDSTTADQLGADLINFKNDLRGEGWRPVPFKTGPFTTVQWVKSQIVNAWNADPNGVKAILLIGNVPVPYSGSTAWDTKPDHNGAWPCDAYYGDVNGAWTDNAVNIPNTTRIANRNLPGDGKFDQNTLPSAVELPVGRLDFRRLSAATFGLPPVELLRRYLYKNHLWRTGQYRVPNRALVDDHLGWSGGEAFAADGYRNAYPLCGANGVTEGELLGNQRYLLGYGAGWGSYDAAGGLATTQQLATDSVRMIIAQVYGDYFGDWDFETNPFMPALLASKGGVLATMWAGRPHWMLQGLAAGETMGFCLKETQNAQYNAAYGDANGESGAHIALLGDPTLRAKIVAPVRNLTINSNCSKVNLHWEAPLDSGILGYVIYRAFGQDGPYTRVSPHFVFQTSWEDLSPVADTLFYSVRAVKLEVTPGGGAFYNSSSGAPKSVIFVPGTGPTAIALGGVLNCNVQQLTLGTNFQPPTSSVQWYNPDGSLHNGFIATEGGVYTVVVTAPNGCTVAAYATVILDTLLPQVNLPSEVVYDCIHTSQDPFVVPDAPSGVHYYLNGAEVFPGQNIPYNNSFNFNVQSTANGCTDQYHVDVSLDVLAPSVFITHNGLVLDCAHPSLQLMGNSGSGNVSYQWTGGNEAVFTQNVTVTAPGQYCLMVTGTNGCTSSSCVTVTAGGAFVGLQIVPLTDPCSSAERSLKALVGSGTPPYQFNWSNGSNTDVALLPAGFSGTVSLTVTDAQQCSATGQFELPAPLEVLALTQKETAPGALDGAIDLLVFGGTAPLSFQWSNGSTTEDIFGLAAGNYTVTVSSADGCSKVLNVPVSGLSATTQLNDAAWLVYPNPAGHFTGVYAPDAPALLRVYTPEGLEIVSEAFSSGKTVLHTGEWAAGVYILALETPSGRSLKRLVINH